MDYGICRCFYGASCIMGCMGATYRGILARFLFGNVFLVVSCSHPLAVIIFAKLGLYRAIVRHIGSQALFAIVKSSGLMELVLWSLV